jgi:hypothetical protein
MKDIITLATDGCDRATAYHMSSKIVRRPDGLYVSWLDSRYRTVIARVDPETGAVQAATPIVQGYDNHCSAGMANGPDGKLHVVTGSHAMGFVYRWSENPADPQSWSLPEGVGAGATYPSLLCDSRGTLYLAHRHTSWGGHYGVHWVTRARGEYWSWPYTLVQAPATAYTFPTNSLALATDGTIHLLVEFYKTYPEGKVPSHSMAITHLESPDGGKTWLHADGRKVELFPVCLEDTQPVKYKGGGNIRPGNVIVLPDGHPAFTIWDSLAKTLELAIRRAGRVWEFLDLTEPLTRARPGWGPNLGGQVAVDKHGKLVVVAQVARDAEWGSPSAELHVLWVEPATGRVIRDATIPKLTPDAPDWLASIEKGTVGLPKDDLFLIYTSGRRGEGCVNEARCAVRLVRLAS